MLALKLNLIMSQLYINVHQFSKKENLSCLKWDPLANKLMSAGVVVEKKKCLFYLFGFFHVH